MLASVARAENTPVRLIAFVIAALLVVPAPLVLSRQRRTMGAPADRSPRSVLDVVWVAVPVVLLVVLTAFSAAE